MMTDQEIYVLAQLQKGFGPISFPDEALQYALQAEQTCLDLGPHDSAYERFKFEQQAYEKLALLLEKAQ